MGFFDFLRGGNISKEELEKVIREIVFSDKPEKEKRKLIDKVIKKVGKNPRLLDTTEQIIKRVLEEKAKSEIRAGVSELLTKSNKSKQLPPPKLKELEDKLTEKIFQNLKGNLQSPTGQTTVASGRSLKELIKNQLQTELKSNSEFQALLNKLTENKNPRRPIETALLSKISSGNIQTKVSNLKSTIINYITGGDEDLSKLLELLYNEIGEPDDRFELVDLIEEFKRKNPEFWNSLRLYGVYITYGSATLKLDTYKTLIISQDEELERYARQIIYQFEKQSRIRDILYQTALDLVSYGDAFWVKLRDNDGRIKDVMLIPSYAVAPVVNLLNDLEYIYVIPERLKYAYTYIDPRRGFSINKLLKKKLINIQIETPTDKFETEAIKLDRHDIVHFNDGTFVGLADSPIIQLVIIFRIMRLLEETLILYRITRAKRLMVFFVDVGVLDEEEQNARIQRLKDVLNSVLTFNTEDGIIYTRQQHLKISSNIILPIYGKDDATKVQVIQGDRIGIEMESMTHYFHRLINNLLTSHIFGDKRTGKEEQIEEAFKMFVRLYQSQMASAITKLYYDILQSHGLDISQITIQIEFPSPDVNQELKLIDTILRRIMVVAQLIATLGVAVPPQWVVNYVFKDLTNVQIQELINYIERVQSQTSGEFGFEQFLTGEGNKTPAHQQTASLQPLLDFISDTTNSQDLNVDDLNQQATNQKPLTNSQQLNQLKELIQLTLDYLKLHKQQ